MLHILNFNHPWLTEWPQPSRDPIHMLFNILYVYKYQCHIETIYNNFYLVVYRAICGTEMPRLSF